MASVLNEAYFQDEQAAFDRLETIVWPAGPVCPKCGCAGRIGALEGVKDKKGNVRLGLKKCYDCRGQFTVRVGTVFERSHVALHIWFQAAYLLCSSKKGVSSNQLSRTLGVALQTAWFMSHRLRESMRSGELAPFGFEGGIVEIDETFIGNDRTIKPHGEKKGRGYAHKHKVLSLVDRDTKQVRSMVVDNLTAAHLTPILEENIAKEARVMTDEAGQYKRLKDTFEGGHGYTRHGQGEYVDLAGC